MRSIALLVALLCVGCLKPQPTPRLWRAPPEDDQLGALPVTAQAQPAPDVCEPRYVRRAEPMSGERVERVCPDCDRWQLCTAGLFEADPWTCQELSTEEYDNWQSARMVEVLVEPPPECEERQAQPAVYRPSGGGGGGSVHVRGYRRRDGTYVRPHTRHRPRR
jgi:hypothetical protein